MFRRERGPVTAARIANELEVTARTVYRDIASLMANGVPIRGEAGIGYVMDEGYDLPPLMFSADELEALMLGARLVAWHGDTTLTRSANDAIAKIATVIPDDLRPLLLDAPLYVPDFGGSVVDKVDVGTIRRAIRANLKLHINYSDAKDRLSERLIWPIALAYHQGIRMVVSWCELRNDFRHFRVDRMSTMTLMQQRFPERRDALFHRWRKLETEKHGDDMPARKNNEASRGAGMKKGEPSMGLVSGGASARARRPL
jgi:predicted DNA-binding transcriptional regulator YafY